MNDQHLVRAIELAVRAAQCHRTGQPNMAALYEKNCRNAMKLALAEVRRERIRLNPGQAFVYLGQDLSQSLEVICSAVANFVNEAVRAVAQVERMQLDHPADFVLIS